MLSVYSSKKAWQWFDDVLTRQRHHSIQFCFLWSHLLVSHNSWFLRMVYFHYIFLTFKQQITVMIITTNICHIHKLLAKQHLNGCHHYRSVVCANVNICIPNRLKLLKFNRSVVEYKLIETENLWIKPKFYVIKTKHHFSGAQLYDKFITFGVGSCIKGPCNNQPFQYQSQNYQDNDYRQTSNICLAKSEHLKNVCRLGW